MFKTYLLSKYDAVNVAAFAPLSSRHRFDLDVIANVHIIALSHLWSHTHARMFCQVPDYANPIEVKPTYEEEGECGNPMPIHRL